MSCGIPLANTGMGINKNGKVHLSVFIYMDATMLKATIIILYLSIYIKVKIFPCNTLQIKRMEKESVRNVIVIIMTVPSARV